MSDRSRILVIEHEPDDPPAWFGVWLRGRRLRPARLPALGRATRCRATSPGTTALLVMGGWMSAHHDEEVAWLTGVKDADAAGRPRRASRRSASAWVTRWRPWRWAGTVETNPRGQQIGLYDVGWLPEAAGRPADGRRRHPAARHPLELRHRHRAARRRRGAGPRAGGEVQAARFGPAMWGVQWHPEIDEPLLRRWVDDDPDSPAELGLDAEQVLARGGRRPRRAGRRLAAAGAALRRASCRPR